MIAQYPTEANCTEDEYKVHLSSEHVNILKQFVHLKSLSFNILSIKREDLDNLLISLAQYNNLKVLNLEFCYLFSIIHDYINNS